MKGDKFVKICGTYYRVTNETDNLIECEARPFTEEQVFEIQNEEELKSNKLAMHYYNKCKYLERRMDVLRQSSDRE